MSRFISPNANKEMWYGFDKNGRVIETFYGNYSEAVDYFNSEESSPRVEHFDRKESLL